MRLPKTGMRLLSVILALVLVLVGTVVTSLTAGASSYASQIRELENKQAQLKTKINQLQNDIDEQTALKAALQERIDAVQEQIDLYNEQINGLQAKIDKMDAEKAVIEEDLEKSKDIFFSRIRAMYIAGNDSALTVLLGADDFGDYLYQDELLATVTEYDNKIMNKMKDDINKISELEAEVEKEKQGIEDLRKEVDVKRKELGADMKSLNAVISKLEGQQSELKFDLADYQKQIDALEKKIQTTVTQNKNENIQFSGGQFLWPVPGYYYISSNYGWRWGRMHRGTDIAGSNIYGKPIVAAADGVVSLVDYNGGGYGYYVMVNHGNKGGNNYVTLYAHMSKQAAYVGQKVKAGQTIGYVGSTGASTGPHLHFEIRVNGSAQNPMNFYSNVG